MSEPTKSPTRALVLGGGGVAGIAWEYGLIAGLAEQGIHLDQADLVVGTSAGSVVGATLLSGGAEAAFASQSVPIEFDESAMSNFNVAEMMQAFSDAATNSTSEQGALAALGEYARSVPESAMPEEVRLGMVAAQLPSPEWPEGAFRVTAVNATDGAFIVFDATSGVELPRAIMASCSVPGVGPTTLIDGTPYMDGGTRSGTNADVAAGFDRVLVIACSPEPEVSGFGPTLSQASASLREHSDVLVIEADEASIAAFGPNPLLMSTRGASAAAGYAQSAQVTEAVKAFWN